VGSLVSKKAPEVRGAMIVKMMATGIKGKGAAISAEGAMVEGAVSHQVDVIFEVGEIPHESKVVGEITIADK